MRVVVAAVAVLLSAGSAFGADPPPLVRARTLYNAADYDGAVAAAALARMQPATADGAALVEGRARLERYRRAADAMELTTAREALMAVHPALLSPRDQVEYLVGLGQTLYFAGLFGPAAALFDTALERGTVLPDRDRLMLLDWWATALDREAQMSAPDRRIQLATQIRDRMEQELRRDPGSAPANYWLAVAARAAGDVDMAWDAAIAAWVRAALSPAPMQLRADIDTLVIDAIIPERVRPLPSHDQPDAAGAMRGQWETIKTDWK